MASGPISIDQDASHQAFDRKVFRGGRSLLASQAVRFCLRVVSTLVVARLLTPDDYGVFGMALVLYGLIYGLRDLGLLTAAVSIPELGSDRKNQVFWLSITTGFVLTGLFWALGPLAARWNSEPRLIPMFHELALCFLINGFGTLPQACLSRELHYPTTSLIEIASMAVSIVVAVGFAIAGYGYWALVHMTLSAEIIRTLCSWAAYRHAPGAWRTTPGIGRMVRLGLSVASFAALNYTAVSCDQFLIGIWFGPRPLGLYGRASQFTFIPAHFLLGPISSWMVAALSRLRDEPVRYRALNQQVTTAVAHAIYPLSAAFVAAPTGTITLLLGAKWHEAGPLLRFLGFGLLAQPLLFAQNWLMMSQGRGLRLIGLALANLVALLALCWWLKGDSVQGIAIAWSATALLSLLGVAWAVQGTPIHIFHDLVAALRRPFALFLVFASVTWAAVQVMPQTTVGTLAALTAGGLAWAGLGYAWKSARNEWWAAAKAFGGGSGRL